MLRTWVAHEAMVTAWWIHGNAMVTPWCDHGESMVVLGETTLTPRLDHGESMASPWRVHSDSSGTVIRLSMETSW